MGHALSAQSDSELLEVLAEKQIPLELNVTSNLRTGCCKDLDSHPVKMYFESGLMVTINSDDPPMFGSNLLEEYVLLEERFEFSLEQLRELAANSVEASFLPPQRKLEFCGGWSSTGDPLPPSGYFGRKILFDFNGLQGGGLCKVLTAKGLTLKYLFSMRCTG